MSTHLWVALQYTPIVVELDPDGTLHTSTEPVADEVAREDSVLGCLFCDTPLTTETFGTECAGKNDVDGDLDIE